MASPDPGYGSTAAAVVASLDWSGTQLTPLEVTLTRTRDDSIVAQVVATDGMRRRDLILKQYLEYDDQPRPPRDSARIEAETIRSLAHMRPSERGITCAVPGLVLFDDARAAIVIDKANGHPLDTIVINARNRGKIEDAQDAVCEAGAWLRSMQEVTESTADASAILDRLLVTAERDADRAGADVQRLRRKLTHTLQSLTSSMGPQRVVRSHGDYWPGNVFVSNDTVAVIDFEGSREGLPLEDVAYFLIHLEMYFKYPLMRRQYEKLERAFLSGYAGGGSIDRNALRFMMIIKALQTMARGGAAETGSLRSWLLRRTVRKTLMRSLRG